MCYLIGQLKNEACFLHVLEGDATFFSGNQKLDINPSDSLFLKCGHYVNKWIANSNQKVNEAVLIHFHPEVLKWAYQNELPEFLKPEGSTNFMAAKVEVTQVISTYVESLLFYFQHPTLVNEELLKLKVKELLLLLFQTQGSEKVKALLADLFTPIKFEIAQVVSQHLSEDLSLNDYAAMLGMSLSGFKRKFKAEFNQSPRQYIIEKRVELAKQRLRQKDSRVSDVAFACGFTDVAYFTKCFAKHVGVPPGKYKAQQLS